MIINSHLMHVRHFVLEFHTAPDDGETGVGREAALMMGVSTPRHAAGIFESVYRIFWQSSVASGRAGACIA